MKKRIKRLKEFEKRDWDFLCIIVGVFILIVSFLLTN